MPLIKSISGIRGTVGGQEGTNLSLLDIVKFTAAYASLIKPSCLKCKNIKIVIGRDARPSGLMIKKLVIGTLLNQGISVIDLDLATTPTVEMLVIKHQAQGGIIITASHNPQGWNALKFLNQQGEFLTVQAGQTILKLAEVSQFDSAPENKLGIYSSDLKAQDFHLQEILKLKLVKPQPIRKKKFKIVVDGINSVGGLVIPQLLGALGVTNIIKLNCSATGQFAHSPEPLDKNLTAIKKLVLQEKADLGIVVDPDVDRLAFIDEQGNMFGEEYTLVAIADYILKNKIPQPYHKKTVSNLSSSRALSDIAQRHGGSYQASAVGELHVVQKMKDIKAVIGGEGNGGLIYPQLHYGRDALVGVALFLSYLATTKRTMSQLKQDLPQYFMVKDKMILPTQINLKQLFNKIQQDYPQEKINRLDGLKIDWSDSWVHLRASNTEAILRIYSEASSQNLARKKIREIKKKILAYIK